MNADLYAVTAVGPVCLDELVTVVAEYPTDHRWNGWLCPNLDPVGVIAVRDALDAAYAAGTDDRAPRIEFVDGDLHVTEFDGDDEYLDVLTPDASGLYSLGAYAWTWSVDHDAARAFARTEYAALVLAMGDGFHPDTRGDDYTSLPDEFTAEGVDRIVEAAFDLLVDPYAIANRLLDSVRDETGVVR
jgi:hypothetical protein